MKSIISIIIPYLLSILFYRRHLHLILNHLYSKRRSLREHLRKNLMVAFPGAKKFNKSETRIKLKKWFSIMCFQRKGPLLNLTFLIGYRGSRCRIKHIPSSAAGRGRRVRCNSLAQSGSPQGHCRFTRLLHSWAPIKFHFWISERVFRLTVAFHFRNSKFVFKFELTFDVLSFWHARISDLRIKEIVGTCVYCWLVSRKILHKTNSDSTTV